MTPRGGSKSSVALSALERFHATSLDDELGRCLHEAPPEAAFELYRQVRARVPAYPRFLEQQGGVAPAGKADATAVDLRPARARDIGNATAPHHQRRSVA